MSTSKAAVSFDSSLPRTYSNSWREAYGQDSDTPRLSSYQAPGGEPVAFAYDSITLGGGQNIDTAEYPYGFWSNTRLGEKPHTIKIKGHIIGEKFIEQRSKLAAALQTETDDDNPGLLDLPLWGRFKVVVEAWNIDEDKAKTGMSNFSFEFKRAGYSDTSRFNTLSKNLASMNIDGAVDNLKSAAVSAFTAAVEKSLDIATLSQSFIKLASKLQTVIGRVQGGVNTLNAMTNKVMGITNLIAQAVMLPRSLAQAFVNAAFSIVSGIMEIKNAADAAASYFLGNEDDSNDRNFNSPATSSTLSSEKQESVMESFISRNEKNVLMQFLTASSYTLDEETITEQQFNTSSAVENLYKSVAFGVCAQLLTRIGADDETYQSLSGLWSLLEKLEDSIAKENSELFASIEECRVSCAEMLLSFSHNVEIKRIIKKDMPLLELAMYLGCDDEKIRSLNSVADSFLIKGDICVCLKYRSLSGTQK